MKNIEKIKILKNKLKEKNVDEILNLIIITLEQGQANNKNEKEKKLKNAFYKN